MHAHTHARTHARMHAHAHARTHTLTAALTQLSLNEKCQHESSTEHKIARLTDIHKSATIKQGETDQF